MTTESFIDLGPLGIVAACGSSAAVILYPFRLEEESNRSQDTEYQKEMVARREVPFEVLSDANLDLTRALRLPAFEFAGAPSIKRLTLMISQKRIEKVFYPVFPPDQHAMEVIYS